MKASAIFPKYTVIAVDAKGTEYRLKNVTTDLTIDEPQNGIAVKVQFSCANVKVETGYLFDYLKIGMLLFVYADDGNKNAIVMRGILWGRKKKANNEREISITGYTKPIYLQKSKGCYFFSAGKKTDAILKSICKDWGISCIYEYDSISHPKLPLNNKAISDMFIEVLNEVKKQKGSRYVIRSEDDDVQIKKCGSNSEIYHFISKKSLSNLTIEESLDDVVTKVIVVGKEDDNERVPVEATVTGKNIKQYGTLQDIVQREEGTSLATAKAEANEIIEEKGTVKPLYSFSVIDVPWVHKGDMIKITAPDVKGDFYVLSVSHNAKSRMMDLDVEGV